jgi:mono/diheme cytochrome c family protein
MVVTMILLGYVAVTEQTRMENFSKAYEARQIETGAALFENNCKSCHGDQGQGVPAKGPQLNYASMFDEKNGRVKEANFPGTADNFIRLTIAAGRPQASAKFAEYPQRMPTWGEQYGGPLRTDQVNALTAYVMNWGKAYTNGSGVVETPIDGAGTDITVELPTGDIKNGEKLAKAKACTACHIDSNTGPAWLASMASDGKGVGTYAIERYLAGDYKGQANSPELYLFESIVNPNAYIVPDQPTYANNGTSIMPPTYGAQLTRQDVADLIAYLLTLK